MNAFEQLMVSGECRESGAPIEMYGKDFASLSSSDIGDSMVPQGPGRQLDIDFWLPQAAKVFEVSPKLEDYVVVPNVAFWTGVSNTNGDSVRAVDTIAYRATDGMCMYETFRGKGSYWNHENNTVPELASGLIFDSYLRPVENIPNVLKVVLLVGFCRQKNPELAKQILNRQITSYSVGMTYDGYEISTTGDVIQDQNQARFAITRPNQPPFLDRNGEMVFRYLINPRGLECSAVPTPAFASAVGDTVMDLKSGKIKHYD